MPRPPRIRGFGGRTRHAPPVGPRRNPLEPVLGPAKCPSCGVENMLPGIGMTLHCTNCGAHLKRKDVDHKEFIIVPEDDDGAVLVILSESEAKERWRRSHPEVYKPIMECSHCNASITIQDAQFCPNCGCSLVPQHKNSSLPRRVPKPTKRGPIGASSWRKEKCMVCNLEFDRKDDVVCCPHCGKLAHRDHLISWISKKGTCPICRRLLNQQDYQ